MGLRRMGSVQRKTQRAKARKRNSIRKIRERASRDRRMVESIQGGSLPFVPWVMSWLCEKLEKAPRTITQADVEQVLAREAAKPPRPLASARA